uniref:AIG1-type G domain-containing protein n=1 Tax=Biomphalaria glabrata TaxID=6526 RepID=A0A2C9KA06_BIOGL
MEQFALLFTLSKEKKEEKIGLLLAGPLGGGKSATGNSILLSNIFIPQTNQKSPTKKKHAQVGYKVLYNQGITVVDGIDLTFFHENESFECAFFLAEKCIEKYGNGFNALLYVVSYTGTFLYDSKYFSVLENILGEDFVTNKSILIVTYGDCFISSNTENISFDNWCSAQEDPFKKLFLKCGGRAVLFDNNTQDKKRKEKQIKELLHIVNDMNDGKKYYKKDFNLDKSGVCNNTTKLLSEK